MWTNTAAALAAINPVAIQLGPLAVRWYGLIMVTAIGVGIWLAMRETRRLGLDPGFIEEASIWVVPAGIIGARLYEVFVLQWGYYREHPWEIPAIWHGGMAIHGTIIAVIIVGYWFFRRKRASFWQWADIMMPSLLLGQAIGRWGNFMNQEAFGGPAPDWVVALMPGWFRDQMTIAGTVMHPTFFYESIWNLLGFLLLVAWRRRNPLRGSIFLGYLFVYSLGRALIESIRMDSSFFAGGLRIAQVVSIATVVLAVALWAWRARRVQERYVEVTAPGAGAAPEPRG